VSTGDGSRDEDRGGMTSALKVWYLGGGGGEALAKGRVTGITVDDDGVASVNTDAGPETLYAGEDGKLHRQRTAAGRASLPRLPVVYGKEETKRPYWGGGGRSGPAREAHATPPTTPGLVAAPKDLATLPKGNARLVGLADGKLQIVGFANAGGTTDGSAAVPLRTLEGHRAAVEFAAVSPNGRFIVSADRDRTVRVWDVMRPARGRELEHDMRAAYDLIDNKIDKPSASFLPLETLRSWYAFCGHEVAISELEKWESLAAGVSGDSGNAR
jgi:hypothetical protein